MESIEKAVRALKEVREKHEGKIKKLQAKIDKEKDALKIAEKVIHHIHEEELFANLLIRSLTLLGDEDPKNVGPAGDRYYLVVDDVPVGFDPLDFGFMKHEKQFSLFLDHTGRMEEGKNVGEQWEANTSDVPDENVDGIFVQSHHCKIVEIWDGDDFEQEMIDFFIKHNKKSTLPDDDWRPLLETDLDIYIPPETEQGRLLAKAKIIEAVEAIKSKKK